MSSTAISTTSAPGAGPHLSTPRTRPTITAATVRTTTPPSLPDRICTSQNHHPDVAPHTVRRDARTWVAPTAPSRRTAGHTHPRLERRASRAAGDAKSLPQSPPLQATANQRHHRACRSPRGWGGARVASRGGVKWLCQRFFTTPPSMMYSAPVMLLGEAAKATRRATSSGVLSRPVEAPRLFLS